jgi:hypothetical protein
MNYQFQNRKYTRKIKSIIHHLKLNKHSNINVIHNICNSFRINQLQIFIIHHLSFIITQKMMPDDFKIFFVILIREFRNNSLLKRLSSSKQVAKI